MLKQYNEDIEFVLTQIDSDMEEKYRKLKKEWQNVKRVVKSTKTTDKELKRDAIIAKYKLIKKYLIEINKYEYYNEEYEFYKIMLEYMGIDEYLYESTMKKLKIK